MDFAKSFDKFRKYTKGEEIFNSVSHGVGALGAIAGTCVLICFAFFYGSPLDIVSCSVYGATLFFLYLMSTLYHSLTNEKAKRVFRVFDHCSIFLLIAGTYTPFTLITLRGALGYTIFGIIWGAAILGIVLNAISLERFRKFSLVCYLLMGWAIIFAIRPLLSGVSTTTLVFLILGGVAYSGGMLFYNLKRYRYMHSIWHLFVLAGSIFHYISIFQIVLS